MHARPLRVGLAASLLAMLGVVVLVGDQASEAKATAADLARPNIVFVLTDDMSTLQLPYMPAVQSLLADQGASFDNYLVTNPLCCPSRTTTLRGQYSHNTGIFQNSGSNGGFHRVYDLGLETTTVATSLRDAGYRTGLIGKYLNEFYFDRGYVPPGWDQFGGHGGNTDRIFGAADTFVREAAVADVPFFLWLSPTAPHFPATTWTAPRHNGLFLDETRPQAPSFNEVDVSDKPPWIQTLAPLGDEDIRAADEYYRHSLQSLQAVDEGIAALVDTLIELDQLNNTYLVFSSDNGIHHGEHRLPLGKGTPYEEDIRVPLVIRGPGVAVGSHVAALAGNVDLAPTFIDLAGASPYGFEDGRSLVPLFAGSEPSAWRSAMLIEHLALDGGVAARYDFRGLRTRTLKYVEYTASGERELYDLAVDPFELDNVYETAEPVLKEQLATKLEGLASCEADSCRRTEADLPVAFVGRANAAEGSSGETLSASVSVHLSVPQVEPVTIEYATADGSATSGVDYGASAGTVTFAPGETIRLITIEVLGDELDETDETVRFTVSDPTGAISTSAGTLLIEDDDPSPVVGISDAVAAETPGGSTAVFTLSLSDPPDRPLTVGWWTVGRPATAGVDFSAGSGTVTFAPGDTSEQVEVPVFDDGLDEAAETFTVHAQAIMKWATPSAMTSVVGVGTIVDDDLPPSLSIDDVSVVEVPGGSSAVFTLSLSSPSAKTVRVTWRTSGGGAASGVDYLYGSGVLTFVPGQTSKQVVVSVLDDVIDEQDERFGVVLSVPVNVTIVRSTGVGTIVDDDP